MDLRQEATRLLGDTTFEYTFSNAFQRSPIKLPPDKLTFLQQLVRDEDLQRITQELYADIFNTGFAHFAINGTDEYMKDMGLAALSQIFQKLIDTYLTHSPGDSAADFGFISKRETAQCVPDSPLVFTYSTPGQVRLSNAVFLPIDFILLAKSDPHIILSQLAFMGSQMRDAANRNLINLPDRAYAFEAEFIRQCQLNHPALTFLKGYLNRSRQYTHQQYLDLNYLSPNLLPPDVNLQ